MCFWFRASEHPVLQSPTLYLPNHPSTGSPDLQQVHQQISPTSFGPTGPVTPILPPSHLLTRVHGPQHRRRNFPGNSHLAYTIEYYRTPHQASQSYRKQTTIRNASCVPLIPPSQSFRPSISNLFIDPCGPRLQRRDFPRTSYLVHTVKYHWVPRQVPQSGRRPMTLRNVSHLPLIPPSQSSHPSISNLFLDPFKLRFRSSRQSAYRFPAVLGTTWT